MSLKVKGLREVQQALITLPDEIERDTVADGLQEASDPMVEAAAANAPEMIGRLRRGIKFRLREFVTRFSVKATIGTSYSKTEDGYAPHAHLVEFGTGPRQHKDTGKSTGEMPAFPFMRPAYDAEKKNVITRMAPAFWNAVKRAVQKVKVK